MPVCLSYKSKGQENRTAQISTEIFVCPIFPPWNAGHGSVSNCTKKEPSLHMHCSTGVRLVLLLDADLCYFSISFFFQVCELCPQSTQTTGRISTRKVQGSFFTAVQAEEGSISALTGKGLFCSTLADCLGLKAQRGQLIPQVLT